MSDPARSPIPGGFHVVAVDYDGTLTEDDRPDDEALDAIAAVRAQARRVVLATGPILGELREVFGDVEERFDAIVLEEIRRLGLDCQVMYNRAALMVLPAGVSKGTGLHEALGYLGVSHHSVIGVGDAENDLSLLEECELGVAVANAVPSLKEHADVVLERADGAGIVELLRGPLLSGQERVLPQRWQVPLGRLPDGNPALLPASQVDVIITGGTRAGKSYTGGLLAEQLIGLGYSLLVVDFDVVLALPSPDRQDQRVIDFLALWAPESSAELTELFATAEPGQGPFIGPSVPQGGLVTIAARSTGDVRHWHEYVRAALPVEQRFYFRHGEHRSTGHAAANVYELLHILRQCDDEVVDHHSRGHDLSRGARHVLQDPSLAPSLAAIEADHVVTNDSEGTRQRLLRTIEHRYLE